MSNNARTIPCDLLYRPTDPRYAENIRQYQGCPTIAVTPGGRICLGWYSGGTTEPHIENYNLLIYSDDEGRTWSAPLLVIPSSREKQIHALDIQLWTDPRGYLHVYWVQNNAQPKPDVLPTPKPNQPQVVVDGWLFDDFVHSEWEIICENPDDENRSSSKTARGSTSTTTRPRPVTATAFPPTKAGPTHAATVPKRSRPSSTKGWHTRKTTVPSA